MKKLICFSLAIIFALSLPLTTSASSEITENQVEIGHITVTFEENTVYSAEEQQFIAQQIVNGNITDNQTYGLVCNVFGHKTTTELIEVVEHCVHDTIPRCLLTYYNLTTCSRCDYTNVEYVSSIHINCCA